MVIWQNGHCAHSQGKPACPCTFDFGFEVDDINDLYKESRRSISMVSAVVHNDCLHVRNKLYDRCAGVDQIDL